MRKIVPALLIAASLVAAGTSASAQTILGQWDGNGIDAGTYPVTSAGTNSAPSAFAQRYSSGSFFSLPAPFSSVVTQGTPTDPGTDISGTIYNRSFTVNPPQTTDTNESQGAVFNVSTAGMNPGEAVQLSWSMTVGFRSSRYWQLLASTDGTNFSPVPVGVGSSVTQTVNGFGNTSSPYTPISGTATATVSSAGLVDIQTIDQNYLAAASTSTAPINPFDLGFIDGITFTLPTGQGFENNPNFAFAIVGAFDPNYVGTDGAVGYISSFAGTDSSDAVNGYQRSTFSGGSMKMDLVTVSAVPEPVSVALLGLAALGGLGFMGRRRLLKATR
jgi:hypothetical protein